MLVCRNGTFIPHEEGQLSINDGSFLFGDTLFETLKAQERTILLQKEHLERLEFSARLLNFPCPRSRIETSLQQLASSLNTPASRIRLTLCRGEHHGLALPESENGWYLITAVPLEEISASERESGASCISAPNLRVNPLSHLPQMKRGNYADCLYAADYARHNDAREALFIDPDGMVLEGSTSNIFALRDRRLVTPPTSNLVLAGVMRQQIIDAAIEFGVLVTERDLPLTELLQADEVFLTNSLVDILPVASIDGQPQKRNDLWKSLLKILRLRIET